ncbi:MAG: hypothetical protein ABEH35_00835 [Haloarculaceae archaeon]
MDRLTSCYFCGTALDASLSEYPVVPRDLHPDPDQQRSVVLCQTCRRKLATVVETVVGAIDDNAVDTEAETSELSEPDRDDDTAADSGWEFGAAEADAGGSEPTDTDAGAPDQKSDTGASDTGAVDTEAADTEIADTESADTEAATDASQSAGETDGRPANEGGSQSAGNDGGQTMTALEYNKVMRLLQNREFPVDRAEIREVAVNAYDLSQPEFDAVIEAAVERGLIAEDDGQFVAAE